MIRRNRKYTEMRLKRLLYSGDSPFGFLFSHFNRQMKSYRALILVAGFATMCASGQTVAPGFATGQAARLVIGQPNFTAQNFGASNVLLGSPSGIAFVNGVLWVADANRLSALPDNNRVLRFSDTNTYPTATEDPTIPGATCGLPGPSFWASRISPAPTPL